MIDSYQKAARNALEAGFDGVEIHGANGYLIEQFLQSRTNVRVDAYGGSIANRTRFLLEVTRSVAEVWGARPGWRTALALWNRERQRGTEPLPLYRFAIRELARLNLAYLHLIEPRASGAGQAEVDHKDVPTASGLFRPIWPGVLIAAGNYAPTSANAALAAGWVDAVGFGRLFISNPDLPERIRKGEPLNAYNRATFYGGEAEGYTDYPRLGVATLAS
ncbi:oxidoreductase [Bradyrhizobium sp. USDA 4454]